MYEFYLNVNQINLASSEVTSMYIFFIQLAILFQFTKGTFQ